jgi:uncharacterized protein (UPF0210 family)
MRGLSQGFIPVSEDAGMVEAVGEVHSLDKLSNDCVCSLDWYDIITRRHPEETISAIKADECLNRSMINSMTSSVRIIPVTVKGRRNC